MSSAVQVNSQSVSIILDDKIQKKNTGFNIVGRAKIKIKIGTLSDYKEIECYVSGIMDKNGNVMLSTNAFTLGLSSETGLYIENITMDNSSLTLMPNNNFIEHTYLLGDMTIQQYNKIDHGAVATENNNDCKLYYNVNNIQIRDYLGNSISFNSGTYYCRIINCLFEKQ